MSDGGFGQTIGMTQAIKQAKRAGESVDCAYCGSVLTGDIMVVENKGPIHPECWKNSMSEVEQE